MTSENRPVATPSLDQAIAARVAQMRTARGWSQDELGRRLRERGFGGWTRSVVAALENRSRRLWAADLVALSAGFEVPPSELLPLSEPEVLVDGRTAVSVVSIRKLFEGEHVNLTGRVVGPPRFRRGTPRLDPEERKRLSEQMNMAERILPKGKTLAAVVGVVGELELAISRRLDVVPHLVGAACLRLWGRSATAERDHRVAVTGRAKQGVSRELRKEIEAVLDRAQEN